MKVGEDVKIFPLTLPSPAKFPSPSMGEGEGG
jgi:hypothetical protein